MSRHAEVAMMLGWAALAVTVLVGLVVADEITRLARKRRR